MYVDYMILYAIPRDICEKRL